MVLKNQLCVVVFLAAFSKRSKADEADDADFQLPVKRKKSEPAKVGKQRFAAPLPSDKMEKVCEGFTPMNTSKNTQWAVHSFHDWRESRNDRGGE